MSVEAAGTEAAMTSPKQRQRRTAVLGGGGEEIRTLG